MTQTRKKKAERRKQLLEIMRDLYSPSLTQADFTVDKIAEEAKVSSVIVYRLIGPEFKELRGQLPGPRRAPSSVNAELRRDLEGLREEIRKIKVERKSDIEDAIAGINEIVEELDEENRRLRSRCDLLEQRLQEKGFVVVEVPSPNNESEREFDQPIAKKRGAGNNGRQQ
jgi:hypothetical protein